MKLAHIIVHATKKKKPKKLTLLKLNVYWFIKDHTKLKLNVPYKIIKTQKFHIT